MENPSGNQESNPETGIEKIVSKWLSLYAPNMHRQPEVDQKLQELTLNYMSLLLVKSDEIAEFKRAENIQGSHVMSAIHTLDTNRSLIRGEFLYFVASPLRFSMICIGLLMR